MNLEQVLELVPKIVKTKDGTVTFVCRWSKSEDGWVVGWGVNNTIKARENCGHGKTLLEAILDLNKK